MTPSSEELIQNLTFLQQLQQTMLTQDHDCQANPRFWVVRDYKRVPCWDEQAESWFIQMPNLDDGFTVDADDSYARLKEIIDESDYDEDDYKRITTSLETLDMTDSDYVLTWVRTNLDDDAYLVPEQEIAEIKENTFFLTKEECKRHIKLNQHHYSKRAHTYAMTAWRSPVVERLFNILETTDFQTLIQKIDEQ